MRGNKILKRLTVKDSNTPHSCDYRYNEYFALLKKNRKIFTVTETEYEMMEWVE